MSESDASGTPRTSIELGITDEYGMHFYSKIFAYIFATHRLDSKYCSS